MVVAEAKLRFIGDCAGGALAVLHIFSIDLKQLLCRIGAHNMQQGNKSCHALLAPPNVDQSVWACTIYVAC